MDVHRSGHDALLQRYAEDRERMTFLTAGVCRQQSRRPTPDDAYLHRPFIPATARLWIAVAVLAEFRSARSLTCSGVITRRGSIWIWPSLRTRTALGWISFVTAGRLEQLLVRRVDVELAQGQIASACPIQHDRPFAPRQRLD